MTEQILFEFEVKGGDAAIQEAAHLGRAIQDNRAAIKELSKDYDKNAEEIIKLNNENKRLSSEQRNLAKTGDAVAGSYNSMSAEMAELKRRQKDVNVTTAEGQKQYNEYGKKINDINGKLKKLDETNGVHTRNVGNYQDAIKGATANLNIMGLNVGQLATQFTTASSAVKSATMAVEGTNMALKLLRFAIIATGIGALLLALGSLVTYFTSTNEGAEKFRVVLKQVGQVVNVLVERMGILGQGIAQFVSGDFSEGIDTIKASFTGLGDELEREVQLIGELERRAIKLEKAEIFLNAQRSITKRNIKELQLLAEQQTTSADARVAAIEKAIKLQEDLNRIENQVQLGKIKNLLGETVGREKLDFVLQQINEGFSNITEGANKADAIIEQIGLDPSKTEDFKTLVDLVTQYYDKQSEGLKLERTLTTRLNELRTRAVKTAKEEVEVGIEKGGQRKAELAMNDELEADLMALEEANAAFSDTVLTGLYAEIDAREKNRTVIEEETSALAERRKEQEEAISEQLTGIGNVISIAQSLGQLQDQISTRQLVAAGHNARSIAEIEKRRANRMKGLAISEAIINGALGIVKTGGNLGYPAAIPFQIAQGLQTAVQIATISAQKFAKGGLTMGGMFEGASHAQGGVKFRVGGRIMEAEGGEAIINKRSTRMFKPVLSAINQAGGGKKFATGDIVPSNLNSLINNSLASQQMGNIETGIREFRPVLQVPYTNQVQNGIRVAELNSTL